jgi:hypothetical protein
VTHLHRRSPDHDPSAPPPHGIDALLRSARTSRGIDLPAAAASYSEAKWAFSNPYRGSELTLKILRPGSFTPGEWYDDQAVSAVLRPVVEAARSANEVNDADADGLRAACLCTTAASPDGAWLARLLSGDPSTPPGNPTVGGLLWQFGRMVAVATTIGEVTGYRSLADLVMFDARLVEHRDLGDLVAPKRWRGALLRAESVYAWRLVWQDINSLVDGARAVPSLIEAFADRLPAQPVAEFRAGLPPHTDPQGRPRQAERELEDRPGLQRWIGHLMIGASRLDDMTGQELRGFRGPEECRHGVWEELSPGWVAGQLERFAARSMRDLGREWARALIDRSQRVALQKSTYDARRRSLSFPARLHVRDGIAVKVFEETAPSPATRIPQYLSIARQAGMFMADTQGRLAVGPNGGLLG